MRDLFRRLRFIYSSFEVSRYKACDPAVFPRHVYRNRFLCPGQVEWADLEQKLRGDTPQEQLNF